MDPVQAAIAYANADEDHHGYWLRLYLEGGDVIEGPVFPPLPGPDDSFVRIQPDADEAREPVWISTFHVARVEIVW